MTKEVRMYALQVILLVILGMLIGALLTVVATEARAQVKESGPVTVTVDVETIVRGAPGHTENVLMLTPADIEAEPGWICELVGFGDNGESTHADTNAHISSNGDSVSILDWERVANTRTEATNGTLTLGANITIAIQVGEDGVASGGLEIQFTCNPPGQPPPTTTTPPPEPSTTTTSVTPPTSVTVPPVTTTTTTVPGATTTTTEPPPINGIDTGGGACADGSCDGSLSPLFTWALLVMVSGWAVGLVWAFMRAWSKSDG